MIVRIVKMRFQTDQIDTFLKLFNESSHYIRNFPGCSHLRLLQQTNEECYFFTYSHWESEEALENYRHSELFKGVWAKTKVLFAGPPEAWSVIEKHVQP